MNVKEESGKADLKLNIQKTKIMESSPIASWQIDGKKWKQWQFHFLLLQNHCRQWLQPWNYRMLVPRKKSMKLKLQYFGHLLQRADSLQKDVDAGKDWRQEEKGTTENEMVGLHHCLDGHEFEQAPGVGDGQGGLACCGPRSYRVRHEWATELNWTDAYISFLFIEHLFTFLSFVSDIFIICVFLCLCICDWTSIDLLSLVSNICIICVFLCLHLWSVSYSSLSWCLSSFYVSVTSHLYCYCCLFTQSCLTLWPHGLQHARLPYPWPSSGVCSDSRPWSRWCHPMPIYHLYIYC